MATPEQGSVDAGTSPLSPRREFPIEWKLLGHDPDVKEVLHSGVGYAKLDHGLVFLCDDRLSGICPDAWCRKTQQRWKVDDFWGGGNGIAKADVDLEINAGPAQRNPEPNPDSFIFLVLTNWLSGHGFCMEAKPIGVIQLKRAHFAKNGSEIFSPRGTMSKQVDIASWT